MLNGRDEHAVRAEAAAAKTDARDVLPKLLARRQLLEREAGALGVKSRNRMRALIVCGVGAGLLGAYALWATASGSPPILVWVVTAVLAICAFYLHHESRKAGAERAREVEALHTRMLSLGRQIDRAERTLRD